MASEKKRRDSYKGPFIARVKLAREGSGKEPKEMAANLGIKEDTYIRYEKRTLLPHHLVRAFCESCGIAADTLFLKEKAGVGEVPSRRVVATQRRPRTAVRGSGQ